MFDARLGHVRSYGMTLAESRAWMRGWLAAVAKTRHMDCCRGVNRGGLSCHELYRENLERSRLEVAEKERAAVVEIQKQ
jgi:hypothetical protein